MRVTDEKVGLFSNYSEALDVANGREDKHFLTEDVIINLRGYIFEVTGEDSGACQCAQLRVLHIADCKRPPNKP